MSSEALDLILLEDISRHCPTEFLGFHQCMGRKVPDPDNCAYYQHQLALCIRKGVPAFQRIQSVCAGKLQAYEACLRGTGSKKQCEQDLSELRKCATGSLK